MMKARGATKGSLLFFLIAALVAGGVLAGVPGGAEAKTKKTIYNVEILDTGTPWDVTNPTANNESPSIQIGSLNNAEPMEAIVAANEGITFQIQVTEKAKTKKVKIGKKKVKATYYPVKILGKSFKAPIGGYQVAYMDDLYDVEVITKMKGNAKGKLYITDTDVDVIQVQKGKKPKTKIGDGTSDPAGSLIIEKMKTVTSHRVMGSTFQKAKSTTTWTTGTSSIVFKKSKSALEGMAFPDDDPTGLLTPLVGEPLDLLDEEGELNLQGVTTGTLVSTAGAMKVKTEYGKVDNITGQVWVMKITLAP